MPTLWPKPGMPYSGVNERMLEEMERLLHRLLTGEERRLLLLADEVVDVSACEFPSDDSSA